MDASTPIPDISFGDKTFTSEEKEEINHLLSQKLTKEQIAYREGPSRRRRTIPGFKFSEKIPYLESWRAIEIANGIFGFQGWSSSVINLSQDYIDVDDTGRVSCGVSAVVRVQLKDGAFHEDVGYGVSEGLKSKGASLEKAKKEAVSDALKRTLRLFGNALGNSVYDKQHLKEVKESKATMPPNPIPASGVVPQQQPILGTQVAPVGVSPVSQNQPTSTGVRLQNPPPNRMPQQQGFGQILPSQQNQQPFHQQQQHPVGQPKPFQPPNGQFSHFRGSPQ